MPGMRARVRHDAWRLAVFLVVCLLGVFALVCGLRADAVRREDLQLQGRSSPT